MAPAELTRAVDEALAHDVPHPNAVRQVLERRREQRDQPPPLTLTLPDNDKLKGIVVRPARLGALRPTRHTAHGDRR